MRTRTEVEQQMTDVRVEMLAADEANDPTTVELDRQVLNDLIAEWQAIPLQRPPLDTPTAHAAT